MGQDRIRYFKIESMESVEENGKNPFRIAEKKGENREKHELSKAKLHRIYTIYVNSLCKLVILLVTGTSLRSTLSACFAEATSNKHQLRIWPPLKLKVTTNITLGNCFNGHFKKPRDLQRLKTNISHNAKSMKRCKILATTIKNS